MLVCLDGSHDYHKVAVNHCERWLRAELLLQNMLEKEAPQNGGWRGKKHVNAALLLEAAHGKHCFHLVWTSTVKIESITNQQIIESISDFLLRIEKDILIDINYWPECYEMSSFLFWCPPPLFFFLNVK